MHFQEILEKKRDKKDLTREEIRFFVAAYTNDEIADYQASAMLMAIFLNGLNIDETVWLTESMLHSGIVVDLSDVKGLKVDKHSTGGVGDKTSLIIAPICAALGVPVPMISGRGLGHTGGTLDKLESIPGFNVNLSLDMFRKLVAESHICLIGQTRDIAPADKKLYALRDVTSTVENRSLISASIMSKKLAEGIDALVLDVKTGGGAFMKSMDDAEELANTMISIGNRMGKNITALITDMSQPLGSHVGNALEIKESVEVLMGQFGDRREDLVELSLHLSAHMLLVGGRTDTFEEGLDLARQCINSGAALDKFKEIVRKQGGDLSCLENLDKLPTTKERHILKAGRDGFIAKLDALLIGKGSVLLGAGREKLNSVIDPAVGVIAGKKIGDTVKRGEPVLEIHFNDEKRLERSLQYFKTSFEITPDPVRRPQLMKKTLG